MWRVVVLILLPVCSASFKANNEKLRNQILEDGTKLWRGWNVEARIHYTDVDNEVFCPREETYQGTLGSVVSEYFFDEKIRAECPKLVKAAIVRGTDEWTWIGLDSDAQLIDWANMSAAIYRHFYCAPEPHYCGANFELREMNSSRPLESGGDFFYPMNAFEIRGALKGGTAYSKSKPESTGCYIWRGQPTMEEPNSEEIRREVLADAHQIFRFSMPGYHRYTVHSTERMLFAKEALAGNGREEMSVANIIRQGHYRRIQEAGKCEELVKKRVWQRENGNPITFVSNENEEPGKGWTESEPFYCSPRRGYCGADYPIVAIDTIPPGADFFMPSSEFEADHVTCKIDEYQPLSKTLCFGWKPSSYFPEIIPSEKEVDDFRV